MSDARWFDIQQVLPNDGQWIWVLQDTKNQLIILGQWMRCPKPTCPWDGRITSAHQNWDEYTKTPERHSGDEWQYWLPKESIPLPPAEDWRWR